MKFSKLKYSVRLPFTAPEIKNFILLILRSSIIHSINYVIIHHLPCPCLILQSFYSFVIQGNWNYLSMPQEKKILVLKFPALKYILFYFSCVVFFFFYNFLEQLILPFNFNILKTIWSWKKEFTITTKCICGLSLTTLYIYQSLFPKVSKIYLKTTG